MTSCSLEPTSPSPAEHSFSFLAQLPHDEMGCWLKRKRGAVERREQHVHVYAQQQHSNNNVTNNNSNVTVVTNNNGTAPCRSLKRYPPKDRGGSGRSAGRG